MKRLAPVCLVALVAACGSATTLDGDLVAVSRVLSLPVDDLEVTGADAESFVVDVEGGARLDVFQVALGDAVVVTPLEGALPPSDPIVFVRDPLSKGQIAPFLEGVTRVVVALHPLLSPTQGGVEFDAWMVGLAADGSVLRTDWKGDADERARALVSWAEREGIDPAEAFAMAVRGLVVEDPEAGELEAAEIAGG